jgi:hypothetical protein
MAVVLLGEMPGLTGNLDERYSREYQRQFLLKTDSLATLSIEVRATTGVPRLYDSHPEDTGAFAYKLAVQQQTDDPFLWIVTVDYHTVAGDGKSDPADRQENPLNRPAEVEWSFLKSSVAVTQQLTLDAFGQPLPIVNSAGDAFDPPIEIERSRPKLTITRNEPAFDPAIAFAYQDAVASDVFYGAPAYYAKMDGIKGVRQYENKIFFWKVTYEISFGVEPWIPLKILDQGYQYLAGGKKVLARDQADGTPVGAPVLLDGAGGRLAVGGTPVYRSVTVYRELPFGPLQLG